ncbi:unnamed protein product, partial [Ostreobium quekettii]
EFSGICAIAGQLTVTEFKRLRVEVKDLGYDCRKFREELCDVKREAENSAACRREADDDRRRLRKLASEVEGLRKEVVKLQADKVNSDERAEDEVTKSRVVISLLVKHLSGFLTNPAGQGMAHRDVLKQVCAQVCMPQGMSTSRPTACHSRRQQVQQPRRSS